MKYEIIEFEGINGLEKHVVIDRENGEYLTFPAVDSNQNYIQFKLDIAEEQKK
jgi:hypothetical protein